MWNRFNASEYVQIEHSHTSYMTLVYYLQSARDNRSLEFIAIWYIENQENIRSTHSLICTSPICATAEVPQKQVTLCFIFWEEHDTLDDSAKRQPFSKREQEERPGFSSQSLAISVYCHPRIFWLFLFLTVTMHYRLGPRPPKTMSFWCINKNEQFIQHILSAISTSHILYKSYLTNHFPL